MTISRETLDELTTLELRPAVSILMPTHHAGPEIRQDPIRVAAMGAPIGKTLLTMYVISGLVAGIGGGLCRVERLSVGPSRRGTSSPNHS